MNMVPSFRIIAYYHTNDNEMVSDSVWVDVRDTCMGTVRLLTWAAYTDGSFKSPHLVFEWWGGQPPKL